jgi:hypothetical protein
LGGGADGVEPFDGDPEIGRVHDVVPTKHAVGAVAGQLHRNRLRHKQLPAEPSVVGPLKTFLAGPGKKTLSVSQGSGNQTQSVDDKFDNGTAQASDANPAIDMVIAGVPAVHQGKARGCWAAAVTMLRSHAREQSLTIRAVLAEVGAPYPAMYTSDAGLKPSETAAFMTAFGLRDAGVGALTAEALAGQLRARGPLWVVVDEDPATSFAAHACLVTGIRGDGTASGTEVIFNNPATGAEEREPLASFIGKAQQLANGINSAFGGYSPTIPSM